MQAPSLGKGEMIKEFVYPKFAGRYALEVDGYRLLTMHGVRGIIPKLYDTLASAQEAAKTIKGFKSLEPVLLITDKGDRAR